MKRPECGQKPHLYFIITIPKHHNGWAVVVGLTSDVDMADPLCVLQPSDHPSVKCESYINYSSLALANIGKLEDAFLRSGRSYRRDRKAPSETVYRIQQGALQWPLLEPEQRSLIERATIED